MILFLNLFSGVRERNVRAARLAAAISRIDAHVTVLPLKRSPPTKRTKISLFRIVGDAAPTRGCGHADLLEVDERIRETRLTCSASSSAAISISNFAATTVLRNLTDREMDVSTVSLTIFSSPFNVA